jgi:hypothetical protein
MSLSSYRVITPVNHVPRQVESLGPWLLKGDKAQREECMSKFQMQIETEHPILFVSDASPNVTYPDNTRESFATATADCVCFYVLSHVDGASLVTVTDEECEAGGKAMFSGTIEASTGVLTVTDSTSFHYLNIPVPTGSVSVSIWADGDQNPDWVWIKLGAIGRY